MRPLQTHIAELQSKYQKISIVNDAVHYGEHILYLDTAWQYSSMFEYRYHETMAILPCCSVESLNRVLICGGGDGLLLREVLRFNDVLVDLVEIDPSMIRLYSETKELTDLNQNSLNHPNVTIYPMDALEFIKDKGSYDVIFLDFPSPGSGNEEKQYQNLFHPDVLERFFGLLNEWGVLCSQTSVSSDVMVPFGRRMLDRGFYIWNYDAVYNRAGQHDNFTSCSKRMLTQKRKAPERCRLITDDHVKVGFSEATEVTEKDLDYYRLFEFIEGIELEQGI